MDENCEVRLSSSLILRGLDAQEDPTNFLLSVTTQDGAIPQDVLVYDASTNTFSDTIGPQGEFLLFSCLLYTSPSPRDQRGSRMPSSA